MVRRFLFLLAMPLLAIRSAGMLPSEPQPEPGDGLLHHVRRTIGVLALGAAIVCALMVAALAQDAPVAAPTLAYGSPMLGFAVEAIYSIFGPVILAFLVGVLAKLYGLLGLQQTAENRATVEQVLEMAVRYARMRVGLGGSFAPIPSQHLDAALDIAAEQAFDRAPAALGKVGVSGPGSEALKRMLLSRMDGGGALLAEETKIATAA